MTRWRLSVVVAFALLAGGLAPAATGAPGAYLIIDRAALLALPTSGPAWTSLKAFADGDWGTANLCDQNRKHGVRALAGALVHARTGITSYRAKVRAAILAAPPTQVPGCSNAVLSLGRQLGSYVMAADLIGLDADDSTFRTWLAGIRTAEIGGHGRWHALRFTAGDSANNWGLYATASIIAADRYLGDTASVERDWGIFAGYGVPLGWPFNKSASWAAAWSCEPDTGTKRLPIAIDGACVRSGVNLDGAPVEDASRATFPASSSYIHESTAPLVVSAELLARAGYPAWFVNAAQVCRTVGFADRMGRLNDHPVAYHVAHLANARCGATFPEKTPTSGGRMFGFTDWLYGG